jgi:hypothetical protein
VGPGSERHKHPRLRRHVLQGFPTMFIHPLLVMRKQSLRKTASKKDQISNVAELFQMFFLYTERKTFGQDILVSYPSVVIFILTAMMWIFNERIFFSSGKCFFISYQNHSCKSKITTDIYLTKTFVQNVPNKFRVSWQLQILWMFPCYLR